MYNYMSNTMVTSSPYYQVPTTYPSTVTVHLSHFILIAFAFEVISVMFLSLFFYFLTKNFTYLKQDKLKVTA